MQNTFWENKYLELSSLAVTSSTWKSRLSSWNKFKSFISNTNSDFSWPLSQEIRNGFIVWCYEYGNVSANTVDKYLVHLNGIQSFLGFKKFDNSKKYTKSLLKGFKNAKNLKNKKNLNRKAITFDTLKIIRQKLKNTMGKKWDFQTVWTACCIAFFGCFRLGEILAKNPYVFDKYSDLTWSDVKLHKKAYQ